MSGASQPSEEVYSKLPQWFNLDQSDHMDKAIDVSVTVVATTAYTSNDKGRKHDRQGLFQTGHLKKKLDDNPAIFLIS
ncbi:hypothetical protein PoB_002368500 [Plakobranchus ocellatus]|uniref:Uncharacterized protein n=1 Tax=Plakobranchus ocellatus TaxID=259542 RepID=A0AAV3ZRF7_9GAST|nr:hypothetical protein PoB_002368500 [Plakobranchus ocellatus]